MIFKRMASLIVLSLAVASSAFADDLDHLLQEADRALGNKSAPAANRSDTTHDETIPSQKKSAPRQKKQAGNKTEADTTQSAKESAKPAEPSTLTPIDPARVSEILALDLQAQERERIARGHRVSGRVAFAVDRLPGVYQVEKDDDKFTIDGTTSLQGVALQASRTVPIGDAKGSGLLRGAMFFGVEGSAAALQGSVLVRRTGIDDERRDYNYQIFPIDGAATFGWMTDSQFSAWLALGYGADIVRQLGYGQTDTFTALFSGETLGVGASWRSEGGYEVFGHIKQRGVIGMNSKDPTQSRVAGRIMMLGVGFPI